METSWYTFTHPNRTTHYPLYTSLCTGELNAIRKHKCFLCSPFYVKGVSLGHVGKNQNLKDLKDCTTIAGGVLPRRSAGPRSKALPAPPAERHPAVHPHPHGAANGRARAGACAPITPVTYSRGGAGRSIFREVSVGRVCVLLPCSRVRVP